MDILSLDADQILQVNSYVDMFGGESESLKAYRRLLKKWHPDMNPGSSTDNVFVHINKIYSQGSSDSTGGILDMYGSQYKYSFKLEKSFYEIYYFTDLSGFYIKFNQKGEELKKNFVANMRSLSSLLENKPFKDRYKDLLDLKLRVNKEFIKLSLNKDYVPLNLLLEYIIDFRDWKISAYIMSRMYDHAVMFGAAGLAYIGGDPDFIFVNTKHHTIIDLSAMFFSTKIDAKMIAATGPIAAALSTNDISSKICTEISTNNMIKFLGYHLSGDKVKTGNLNLIDDSCNKDVIKALNNMETSVSENYKKWQTEVIPNVFVARSFYDKVITDKHLLKYIGENT